MACECGPDCACGCNAPGANGFYGDIKLARACSCDCVAKEQPAANGVHVGTALGNETNRWRRRRVRAGTGMFRPHRPKVINDAEIGTEKAEWSAPLDVKKFDTDKRQIFGWASVVQIGDENVVDSQGDIIPVDELENAAYDFVLNSRRGGDMHTNTSAARLIESCAFTQEKQAALGISLGFVGWWIGLYVDSDELWQAVKDGARTEFSIGGRAVHEHIEG